MFRKISCCYLLLLQMLSAFGLNVVDKALKLPDVHLGFQELPGIQFGEFEFSDEQWESRSIYDEDPPILFAESLNVTLIGKNMLSYKNKSLFAFQGLPFAQPAERFKPPLELKPPYFQTENYTANHLPLKCSQHGIFAHNIPAGSEDCLYLSVYIPTLPNKETNEFNESLAVMFFLHGGAFIWGDSSLYLPTRLLDDNVILVVPHYRLGSFGFFSTMDERAPGNIGLYDQRMAMKWVQTHISSFGGDPKRVTIFGQSAGSASVNYHLIMPLSNGLFKGVIGESGSAIEHWSLDPDPLASAMAIGEVNGCDTTNISTVYDCMMALDEGVIALGINTLSLQDRLEGLMGFRGAAPIIQNPDMDLSAYETEPLVTQHPQEYYRKQQFNKDASLMIGANKQEGSFIFSIMYISYMYPLQLYENETYVQEGMISDMLASFGVEDPTHSVAESLAELYLKGADRTSFNSSSPGMIDLSGMLFQKAGTLETAKLHSYYKDSEDTHTYLYAFEYESDDTSFDWLFMGHNTEFSQVELKPGVTHSDELLYLFSWPAIMEGHQVVIKDRLVKLWTNFAKYQDPTPDSDTSWQDLNIPKWPQFDITNQSYILMEDEFTIHEQYTHRWTISNDEAIMITGSTTIEPTKEPPEPPTPTENPLQHQRDAFLGTMIAFIILFVIACALAIYFFYKGK